MNIVTLLGCLGIKPFPAIGKKRFERVLPFWGLQIEPKKSENILRGLWSISLIFSLISSLLGYIIGIPIQSHLLFFGTFLLVWLYLFMTLLSMQQQFISQLDDLSPILISELKWRFDAENGALTKAFIGVLNHVDSFLYSLTYRIKIRLNLGDDPWEVLKYFADTQPSLLLQKKINTFIQLKGKIEIELKDSEFIEKFEDYLNLLEDQFSVFISLSSIFPIIIILFVLMYRSVNTLSLVAIPIGHFFVTKILFLYMNANKMKVLGW